MTLRRARNKACSFELREEFFQGLSRSFQSNRFSSVSLIGFEVDVIQGTANQFVRRFRRGWQGFWPAALRQERVQFLPGRSKVAELFQDVPGPAQHRDGAVLVLKQMLEVEHNIGDHIVQRMVKALLHRPACQASDHTGCLRHLTLKQHHDIVRKQVLWRLRGMVDNALNHVQCTFDRTIKQSHGIALFTGLLEPL